MSRRRITKRARWHPRGGGSEEEHPGPTGSGVDKAGEGGRAGLSSAAECGDLATMQTLLAAGAVVDRVDYNGRTALMWAAHAGSPTAVLLLLEAGARVNQSDEYLSTALMLASQAPPKHSSGADSGSILCETTKTTAADTSTGAAAAAETSTDATAAETSTDATAEEVIAQKSQSSVQRGDYVGVISALVNAGAQVNDVSIEGKTALMYAAENGFADRVAILLESGADHAAQATDVAGNGWSQWSALMFAARNNHVTVIELLLDAGASLHLSSEFGYTALRIAVLWESGDAIAKLIAAGADPNEVDQRGRTALAEATQEGMHASVRLLLDYGATDRRAPS